MNRLTKLFKTKQQPILSIYYTAGFPQLNDTLRIAQELEKSGVDMIEIGFPYSDPVADGPVIQHSSEVALKNGMNLKLLFNQLKELRKELSIPVLLMGYFNPVLQFGVEKFCENCESAGIDGLIIPDLPMAEYEEHYLSIFLKHKLSNIFLVTPQSSEQRIRKIDELSNGFIYLLSASSTTGKNLSINTEVEDYFLKMKNRQLQNPLMIGFGISDRKSFGKACEYASGAIVGSAFVEHISQNDNFERSIPEFVRQLK